MKKLKLTYLLKKYLPILVCGITLPLLAQSLEGSKILSESDALGRSKSIIFLDKDNNLTTHGVLPQNLAKKTYNTQGYSGILLDYKTDDPTERPYRATFIDSEKKPVLTSLGYSIIESAYNEDNNEVRRTYMDIEGNPVNLPIGFAEIRFSYDGHRRLTQEAYVDKNGRPALNNTLGYSVMNIIYLDNDMEESQTRSYLNSDLAPISINGIHQKTSGIIKGDNITIIDFFSHADKTPANGPDGYSIHFKRPLDDPQNPKEGFLNAEKKFINGPDGFAKLILKKGKTGEPDTLEYLDENNQPVVHKKLGWYKKSFFIDPKTKKVQNAIYYDIEGKFVSPKELDD